MSRIYFNIGEKKKLVGHVLDMINYSSDNSIWEQNIEFIKKMNSDVIERISDWLLFPTVISDIVYEYSHDITVVNFTFNISCSNIIIKLENQFELLITIEEQFKEIETHLLSVNNDIMTHDICNDICNDIAEHDFKGNDTQVKYYNELIDGFSTVKSEICKIDNFINEYMKRYYNKNNYVHITSSYYVTKCDYKKPTMFTQYIVGSSKLSVRRKKELNEILVLKPINHKLIKQMCIIVKLIHDVIWNTLTNVSSCNH